MNIIIIIMILFLPFGCLQKAYKYYSVRFQNNSDKEIELIEMRSKSGAYAVGGFLSPNTSSVNGVGLYYPANDVYEIEWKILDGERYYKTFDLRDKLPEDFKGDVVFSFNKDNDVDFYQWMSPFQYDYSVELENKSKTTIYNRFMRSSGGVLFVKYKDELKEGLLGTPLIY